MAKLTKKEFADQCLWETKKLSVYIKRKQVEVSDDGLIDTLKPTNKAFLIKYGLPKAVTSPAPAPIGEEIPATVPMITLPNLEDEPETLAALAMIDWNKILPYNKAEQLKMHWEAMKKEEEAHKVKMDNQKKQGEVVPVEPISTLVFQFKQHVLTSEKTADEKILNEMAHKYSMSPEDIAYCRGMQIRMRNAAIAEATEAFKRDLALVLKDYSNKRNVGERT